MQKLIWVLWPSFAVAAVVEVLLLLAIDPAELDVVGQAAAASRLGVYSVGFFLLWGICAASSMTTCFFQRTSDTINKASSKVARQLSDRRCSP